MTGLLGRLAAGELLVAAEACSASAGSIEVMAGLSFDVILIDARHPAVSAYSDELERLVRAADAHDKPALVRVVENTPGTINRAMNDGAAGVVVAVDDATSAARAAASVRYPPRGFRGAAPVVRAAHFGLTPWDDYREATNADRPVIASIESPEALDNVAAIAGADGVDAVLLDLFNLSLSHGSADLQAAVGRLRGAGRVIGVSVAEPNDAAAWRDAGCSFIVVGSDVRAYGAATIALRASLDSVPSRLANGHGS